MLGTAFCVNATRYIHVSGRTNYYFYMIFVHIWKCV